MPFKIIEFYCYHKDCKQDPATELTVKVPKNDTGAGGKMKPRDVYCKHGHLNKISIPEKWGVVNPVLGGEKPVADTSIKLQGEQPE